MDVELLVKGFAQVLHHLRVCVRAASWNVIGWYGIDVVLGVIVDRVVALDWGIVRIGVGRESRV